MLAVLMITFVSVMASTPACAKTGKNDLTSLVPANIIVKQTQRSMATSF